MTFNEANTVEAFICDRLAGSTFSSSVAPGLGWHFLGHADLLRKVGV